MKDDGKGKKRVALLYGTNDKPLLESKAEKEAMNQSFKKWVGIRSLLIAAISGRGLVVCHRFASGNDPASLV